MWALFKACTAFGEMMRLISFHHVHASNIRQFIILYFLSSTTNLMNDWLMCGCVESARFPLVVWECETTCIDWYVWPVYINSMEQIVFEWGKQKCCHSSWIIGTLDINFTMQSWREEAESSNRRNSCMNARDKQLTTVISTKGNNEIGEVVKMEE